MDNVQISWFKLLNQINYLRLFVCFLVTGFYTREQGRQTKGANTTSCEVNHRESLTDDLIRSKMNYRDFQFLNFNAEGEKWKRKNMSVCQSTVERIPSFNIRVK